jgi:hypothetical protein
MNPEQQFARQVCRLLDQGTDRLDPLVQERLRAAREQALACLPVGAAAPSIVGAGGTARLGSHEDGHRHPWRALLVILMLILGMVIAWHWNSFAQADINEEIDSALLADELPPKAYLDPGFQAWLSHYAQSAR